MNKIENVRTTNMFPEYFRTFNIHILRVFLQKKNETEKINKFLEI